jgi:hypothetical protein
VLLRFLGSHCKFNDVVNSCDKLLDSDLPLFETLSTSPPPSSLPPHSGNNNINNGDDRSHSPLRQHVERSYSSPSSPQRASPSSPTSFSHNTLHTSVSSLPSAPLSSLSSSLPLASERRIRSKSSFFESIGRSKGKSKSKDWEQLEARVDSDGETSSNGSNGATKMQIQAGLKSYFDDFRQLLNPAFVSLADVCFVVEGKSFHLHRLILVSRSSYFRTYFRYETGFGPFDFSWMSSCTFHQVTEFLYTGNVEGLLIEHAGPLLVAADMLNLEGLIDICELMMGTWVSNVENPIEVIELLLDSGHFGARQLRIACIEKLASCYSQISETPEFEALDPELKKLILAARKSSSQASSSASTRSSSPPSSFFVDDSNAFTVRRYTY